MSTYEKRPCGSRVVEPVKKKKQPVKETKPEDKENVIDS